MVTFPWGDKIDLLLLCLILVVSHVVVILIGYFCGYCSCEDKYDAKKTVAGMNRVADIDYAKFDLTVTRNSKKLASYLSSCKAAEDLLRQSDLTNPTIGRIGLGAEFAVDFRFEFLNQEAAIFFESAVVAWRCGMPVERL